jgi:hypothetical protein
MKNSSGPAPQKILNGEVHNWYRIMYGYSDHLVKKLITDFGLSEGDRVVDAFCGAGTTMVECMKEGIDSVGIDANPSSVFAARVKTDWTLRPARLLSLINELQLEEKQEVTPSSKLEEDLTYRYLKSAGMLDRGWICPEPLRKALLLKHLIQQTKTTSKYRNALMLSLISEITFGSSNVKFGPELYCGPRRGDNDVLSGFINRVRNMADDLSKVRTLKSGKVGVIQGDARECDSVLGKVGGGKFTAGICSPPYPTDHDYTRNARLELAFLEEVYDRESLRAIKRQMLRSHTKNIYKGDNDARTVRDHKQINAIVREMEKRIPKSASGFEGLYPTVVQEYFGGMKRHLVGMNKLLRKGSLCAYVVGDQSSYFRVHIPTADILGSIAEEVGFRVKRVEHWRSRRSTTTAKDVEENILVLETK